MYRTPRLRWAGRALVVAAVLVAVLAPGVALAQGANDNYPPSATVTTGDPCTTRNSSGICGTGVSRDPDASSASSPFTGGDVALLTVLGLTAALGGIGLVWLGRRRSGSTA